MIDNSTLLKTRSNVTFKPATISKNTGVIFSIMTESIYSLPRTAGIREIISNALDATTRAKSNRPIEIKFPTSLLPSFSVRDFGTGLSYHEIEELYTCLGASSKKEVENEIGFFGIGALSPLAYVEQFTVQSFKDGQLNIYSIFASEDGVPKVAQISSTQTYEPNGMCVSYSVKRGDIGQFVDDIKHTLTYIESNRFKCLNPIAYYKESLKKHKNLTMSFNDTIFIVKKDWGNNSKNNIVMGGVCYEYDPGFLNNHMFSSYYITIEAPIGAVSVQASREKLRMNAKTNAYIESVVKFISDNLEKELQKQIDGAKTFLEALIIKERMTIMSFPDIKWNKQKLSMESFLEEMSTCFDVKRKKKSSFYLYKSPDYIGKFYSLPGSHTRFLLDDVARGGLVRVLGHNNYYSDCIVCVQKDSAKTDEFIKKFGNFFVEKTSKLPEPERKQSVTKVKTKNYLLSKLNHSNPTFVNSTFEFTGDYEKFDGYFIRMKNRSIIYGDKKISLSDVVDVRHFTDKEIMIIDWEENVFPENSSCFFEYFIKNIEEEKEKYFYQSIYKQILNSQTYNLLNQSRDDFKRCISKFNKKSTLTTAITGHLLISSLKMEFKKLPSKELYDVFTEIDSIFDDIVDKYYPILQVLSCSAYHEPHLSILKKYLSEGDQKVFESCLDKIVI